MNVMEGNKSSKFQEKFPTTSPLRLVMEKTYDTGGCPIIPFTWAWDAVYRHLITLGKVGSDELTDNIDKQKKFVIFWLRVTYPDAKMQSDFFPQTKDGRDPSDHRDLYLVLIRRSRCVQNQKGCCSPRTLFPAAF